MKKFLAMLLALVMVLSLVACGSKDDNDSQNDTSIVINGDDGSMPGDVDPDDIDTDDINPEDINVTVKETGKTVEWQMGNITYVYTHDGKKVTDYETRIDMGDEDSAKAAMAAYKANAEDDDDIDDVDRDGQFIVIEYNESGFEYTDYEDLQEATQALRALFGGK